MQIKSIFPTLLFLFYAVSTLAQHPEGWDELDQIIALRVSLKQAIPSNDKKSGAIYIDSLRDLSSPEHWGLLWDERWLAYHWSERHRLLLEEVQNFTTNKKSDEEYAKQPPRDNLFEALDLTMYAGVNNYALILKKSGLNAEEQDFLNLHLQYLLRNNTENERDLRSDFLKRYPGSKYNYFVRTFMELPPEAKRHWFSVEANLLQNNWQSELERNVNAGWGFLGGVNYHKRRWTIAGQVAITYQKNVRVIYGNFADWPINARSSYNDYGFSVGYAVFDKTKVRISPFVRAGVVSFNSVAPTDDDGNVLENPYVEFDVTSLSLGVGLGIDLKLKTRKNNERGLLPPNYAGFKMRIGYNRLNFGKNNPQLTGNTLFFSIGYQITGT
ncbi:MAG: hypothetical protein RIR11_3834 [Bacteroidota bacterium]|jgi:hypothetical protein